MKVYPVDPALSEALEEAYATIRPWEVSYSAELESAIKIGAEAEAKLTLPISVAGSGMNAIEVIFQGDDQARLYSKGLMGSVGKSFMSSGKGHGGGQVVLRGFEAMRNWKKSKGEVLQKKAKRVRTSSAATATASGTDSAVESDLEESPITTPLPRSRTSSGSALTRPPAPTGFFAALKSKMGVVVAAQEDAVGGGDEAERLEEAENERNATEEAMDGPRQREDGKSTGTPQEETVVGDVDELVLVVSTNLKYSVTQDFDLSLS